MENTVPRHAEIIVDNSLFPTIQYTNRDTERRNMWECSCGSFVIASKCATE